MPRHSINNPTDRILRMLDEIAALEAYTSWLEEVLGQHELLAGLPSRPMTRAIIEEEMRQKMGMKKTIYKRNYMQRVRTATDDGQGKSFKQLNHGESLSAARKAEIDKLVADLEPPSATLVPIEDQLGPSVCIEPDPETSGDRLLQDIGKGGFKL